MKAIRVVCAMVEQEGKLLAAQRGHGTHCGLWELPGGKIGPDEDPAAALRRELREELCVETDVGDEVGRYRHAYSDFVIELIAFHCRLCGAITCVEHQAVRWVTPIEADELDWTPADIPLVRQWCAGKR